MTMDSAALITCCYIGNWLIGAMLILYLIFWFLFTFLIEFKTETDLGTRPGTLRLRRIQSHKSYLPSWLSVVFLLCLHVHMSIDMDGLLIKVVP